MINPGVHGLVVITNTTISGEPPGVLGIIRSPLPYMSRTNVHLFFLADALRSFNTTQTLGFHARDFDYIDSFYFLPKFYTNLAYIRKAFDDFTDPVLQKTQIKFINGPLFLDFLENEPVAQTKTCQPYTNPGAAFDLSNRTIINDLVEPYKWLKL